MNNYKLLLLSLLLLTSAGCSGVSGIAQEGRLVQPHLELKIVAPGASTASKTTTSKASKSKAKYEALSVNIGSIYLESQLSPLSVTGTPLQASDVSINGANTYISYNAVDAGGVIIKKGAVEQVKPVNCDNPATLLYVEYCLSSLGRVEFPSADIFASASNGTNLYAVGSVSDETSLPNFARIYKVNLDANKTPTTIAATGTLPSYAGTGITAVGSSLAVTSGTSTDTTKMGGLSIVDPSTLTITASQQLYDARNVDGYGSSPSSIFVTRGKIDNTNTGAIVEYNANGSGSAIRTLATGGNTIAESKSSVIVGNTLLLVSMGDGGFKVLCKATGATLVTKAAPVIAGIPSSRTVTNSVTAAPGYLFAANGEAGVYIYKFEKSNLLNSNYCQGVTATLLGRLALDSDNSDTTYVNEELSANSVHYIPILNVLSVVVAKMVVVASGNKGLSLLNITNISLGAGDVNDF